MSHYLTLLNRTNFTIDKTVQDAREAEGLAVEFIPGQPAKRPYYGGGHPVVALTDDGQRICCRCKVAKPREAYTRNRNKADGLDARCRECKSAVARQRRVAD